MHVSCEQGNVLGQRRMTLERYIRASELYASIEAEERLSLRRFIMLFSFKSCPIACIPHHLSRHRFLTS